MNKNNIILIGFMGVGKGTIARALFKSSGRFSIDTDDLIESITKKKIKTIFKDEGEPYFRDLEKQCALWLEKSITNTVISTGGGFYRQENIKSIGKVVYLKSSFEGILKRINDAPNAKQKLDKRPLLKNLDEAKKLYETRIKEYEKVSDVIVDVEARDMEDIIKELISKCK
ncbi:MULTISPECIES: shikimate kinase [unclassified Arcobacter]|jgi:shikimate kinase|uniref:shikimate kinase n=1 Tax=Arcobacter TaxID=28196 RepID=UPI0035D3FE18